MTCLYDGDLTVLIIEGEPTHEDLIKAIQSIADEFYDLSGLDRDLEELETLRRLKYLEARNNVVTACLYAQRSAVISIGEPFIEDLDLFSNNGYLIFWTGDKEKFLKDLDNIEAQEQSYRSEYLEIKHDMENQPIKKPTSTRKNMLSMINQLEKLGNKIDIRSTTVERLAIMISDERELYNQKHSNN